MNTDPGNGISMEVFFCLILIAIGAIIVMHGCGRSQAFSLEQHGSNLGPRSPKPPV
jgi:hypothetical protein